MKTIQITHVKGEKFMVALLEVGTTDNDREIAVGYSDKSVREAAADLFDTLEHHIKSAKELLAKMEIK